MKKAFSLIEVLVVIAIVAILSAISVPAYNNYKDRAKVTASLPAINDIVNRAKIYLDANGKFPSLTELGYTEGAQPGTIDDPSAVSPELFALAISDPFNGNSVTCTNTNGGTYNYSAMYINAGYTVSGNNNYLYTVYLYSNPRDEGMFITLCNEALYDSQFQLITDFEGYLNCTMPDGTPATDTKISTYALSCGSTY